MNGNGVWKEGTIQKIYIGEGPGTNEEQVRKNG